LPAAISTAGRRRTPYAQIALRWSLGIVLLAAITAAVLGLAFAGSPERLAEGVTVAGIDVGGMTLPEARRFLEHRSEALEQKPVVFTSGSRRWEIRPHTLGVEPNWAAAVEAARRQGEGLGPLRGFKRLGIRFFGADVSPPTNAYDAALTYQISLLAKDIDRAPRDASITLAGLKPVVVPAQTGRQLDKEAAAAVLVRALAAFERHPVGLPVRVDPPDVTAAQLRPVARQVRVAVSEPVRLVHAARAFKIPRWRIATLLDLPERGDAALRVGGPAATAYFAKLSQTVGHEPVDAKFDVSGETVTVIPEKPGVGVDVPRTARNLLDAALSRTNREAAIVVAETPADRTAADAKAMGITQRMASYTTAYAGTPDRIRNLQLGVTALDGTLIPPGAEFSFNERVGERTLERGYRPAPVIIGGEYEEDVGGGVSQVATTAFNAAWEAGLKITERNPHALYISRYQLGRDATVNYPDLDLRFVNDTEHWILITGGYDGGGVTVSLYGGEKRRVESVPGELRRTGGPPVRREPDPTLLRGKTRIEEPGTDSSAVSVQRTVYDEDGDVVRSETWSTSYRGEYRIVRYGTKEPEKKKPEPKADDTPKTPPAERPPVEQPAVTTGSGL
jgi:vancomycin resistance protein YoaR